MPELVASKNGRTFFRISISQKGLTIGRLPDNDLTLTDEDVSRRHAEISWRDGSYYLKDTSSGGTRVDGRPVDAALLLDGNEVGIGSWQMVFREKSPGDESRDDEIRTCIARVKNEPETKILRLDAVKDKFVIECPVLAVHDGKGGVVRFTLAKPQVVLGSGDDCDLKIADDYVSGRHCLIKKTPEGFLLTDLDSTNGTFVNGARIREMVVGNGSEIAIGQTKIELTDEAKEEKIDAYSDEHFCGMVGKSSAMRLLFSKIRRVAPSNHTILIRGETGSGKEMVARSIHELSSRKDKPYLILNCGAISPNIIESELFGHEKGAFTGAHMRRAGAFEQTQGGTLFLDEIGELPLELQPKLLRVLENQTIRRVGGDMEIPVDVRVIAATHRNLAHEVKTGAFREDLYFRLYVIPLVVPPLKERPEDIALLAEYFLREASPDSEKTISSKAVKKLLDHLWPGNVRELKNVILRSLVFCSGDSLLPDDVEIMGEGSCHEDDESRGSIDLSMLEKEKIEEALKKTNMNKTKAARLLGIAKSTLFKKLKEYGIPF